MSTYVHCCGDMKSAVVSDNTLVRFVSKFREFGLDIKDGGSSYREIAFCPWCGKKLPESLRDTWFNSLESQGIDPLDEKAIPAGYLDEKWYEK